MAELLRRKKIAPLAPEGVPNVDILVTDLDSCSLYSVQVKACRNSSSGSGWRLTEKSENIRSDRFFYFFVDFCERAPTCPVVYILPICVVAEVLFKAHRKWLANPGRNGQAHNDNPTRWLRPDYTCDFGPNDNPYPKGWLDKYSGDWDQLGLGRRDNDPDPDTEE